MRATYVAMKRTAPKVEDAVAETVRPGRSVTDAEAVSPPFDLCSVYSVIR